MTRGAAIASFIQGVVIIAVAAWFFYITRQQANELGGLVKDNARIAASVCTDLRYGIGQLAVNFSQRSSFEANQSLTTAAGKLAHQQAVGWNLTAKALLKHKWTACDGAKPGAVQRTQLHVLPTPTTDPRQALQRARATRNVREE